MLTARRSIATAALLAPLVSGASTTAQPQAESFPAAAIDYVHDMDGGIKLGPAEVRKRL